AAALGPSSFLAKLWQLVNSPHARSVHWDAHSEGLPIHQPLFEHEVLGAGSGHALGVCSDGAAGAFFKTKNFSSFICQLNLYDFCKVVTGLEGSTVSPGPVLLHHFHSPHFHRCCPDFLVHLKHRTSANKVKLAASQEVTSCTPNCSLG
ncbi:HSF5 protein, partial [Rhynochetos jubatus]|nr:HSF5 protein [Rhynochetos jubatus]